MADVKISGLGTDSSLAQTDYVPVVDQSGPTTKRTLLSTLAAFLFNQVNIPTASGSPITRDNESMFAFVASGMVWSGDAYASTKNASMTAGIVYINGRRISISAVTARVFTASKDTYVDILDNADGTGTLVYTEVTNNAASPALAANSIRIAIIVTGATNIAAAGSVNQGQETIVLPIASSIPYAVTDSLGNLICSRDPAHQTLGYRQSSTNQSGIGATDTLLTGLSLAINLPTARKIKVEALMPWISSTNIASNFLSIYNAATVTGSPIQQAVTLQALAGTKVMLYCSVEITLAAGAQSFCAAINTDTGTCSTSLLSTRLANLRVSLA